MKIGITAFLTSIINEENVPSSFGILSELNRSKAYKVSALGLSIN